MAVLKDMPSNFLVVNFEAFLMEGEPDLDQGDIEMNAGWFL